MSKVSQKIRLSNLRKDAVARGVLSESVYPPKTFGAPEHPNCNRGAYAATRYDVVVQRIFTGAPQPQKPSKANSPVRGNANHLVLHARPQYVYGDVNAYLYVSNDDDPPKAKNKSKRRILIQKHFNKCDACTENTGKCCMRLAPSPTGPALASELLVGRALRPKNTQRQALSTRRFPPGRSPLSRSFTTDDCEATDDDPDWSDGSSDDDSATLYSELSDECLPKPLGFGVFVTKDGVVEYLGDCGLFSPNYLTLNLSCESLESDKRVVSYIEGPLEPEWERDDYVLKVAEDFLASELKQNDKGTKCDAKPIPRATASADKKVSFTQLPSERRTSGPLERPSSRSAVSKSSRKTNVALRRLRSIGSSLFRRKPTLHAALFARRKLNELGRF